MSRFTVPVPPDFRPERNEANTGTETCLTGGSTPIPTEVTEQSAPCKRQGGAARVEDCGCQDCLDLLTELQEASDA